MLGYAAKYGGEDSYDFITTEFPPIYIDGITFFDESHKQVCLGD
jgi:hypothetical protein